MSELTDDQLDGLFRKSAEEFQTPPDPAAWPDMKARLDATDRVATGGASLVKNSLRWGLPVVVLLLLVWGSWSVYRSDNRRQSGPATKPLAGMPSSLATAKQKAVTTETKQSTRLDVAVEDAGKEPETAPRQALASADLAHEPATDRKGHTPGRNAIIESVDRTPMTPSVPGRVPENALAGKAAETTEAKLMAAPEKKRTTYRPPGRFAATAAGARLKAGQSQSGYADLSGSTARGRSRKSRFAPYSGKGSTDAYPPGSGQFIGRRSQKARSENATPGPITDEVKQAYTSTGELPFVVIPALTELPIRPATWPKPLSFANRAIEIHPDTTAGRIVPKPAAMRGLSVRFVVAPDLSGVGLKNFSRPGTNVGLLLEYRLASRWSVQAGIIQSTKVYKAAMTDYALPDPAMKWAVKPESVDGRCNMIDIPLNVRYDAALLPRQNGQAPSRWFVSGGVTSYIMKQEDYVYQYADPTNPHIYPGTLGWSGTSGAYGFSELNLSAGYERSISRRLSWQVEPFMKVPLRRVGYLKLNLLSTGTFFSLRYKL